MWVSGLCNVTVDPKRHLELFVDQDELFYSGPPKMLINTVISASKISINIFSPASEMSINTFIYIGHKRTTLFIIA